ncbi:MAG: diacylglycerol kinase family lipid kinase [Verrucomicrobiaceae bacterium]|nr:MAG: diacylglycerol kinase family lipid kinase [Verrucomicrobiaceae bacterium]
MAAPTPPETVRRPIPVIINPNARSARAGGMREVIRALSPLVELHETTGTRDASLIAEKLARAGEPLVVAAGGDGTVNEVVNGIVQAGAADRTALGVLPAGTMNVFAAELGLPSSRLDACWRIIEQGQRRRVDLWRIQDTCFVQLAGAGMDAAIIRATTWELKKRFGPLSYVIAGLGQLIRPAPLMTVQAEDRPSVEGTVVLMGNGRRYGGPFPFFPAALPGDGLLDVVVMRGHGPWEFYTMIKGMLSGHYAPDGGEKHGVTYFQTASLRIHAGNIPLPFEADGELAGMAPDLEVRRGGSLEVMALG